MKTRVLLLSSGFAGELGGIETLARAFVADLARDHDFLVVTSAVAGVDLRRTEWRGIDVYGLPVHELIARRDLAGLMTMRRRFDEIAERFDPHLVHVNHFHPGHVIYLDSKLAKHRPLLYTAHGSSEYSSRGAAEDSVAGRLLRRANRVVGCSQSSVASIRELIPELAARCTTIRNALPERSAPAVEPPLDAPTLLAAGRLVEQKGFDLAIDALAELAGEWPALRLVIAGDGPERSALEARALARGVAGRVEFAGTVDADEIAALMDRALAVLIPSRRYEGLPMVALEAAQAARPVVASDVPGLDEAVVHEATGIVVEQENAFALAAAIGYLLANPRVAREFGRRAERRLRDRFGWDAYAGAYRALYRLLREESEDPNHGHAPGPTPTQSR